MSATLVRPPPKGRAPFQDALDRQWAEQDRREARDIRIVVTIGLACVAAVVASFARLIF